MENWQNVIHAISINKSFEFIHHSTSSIVEIVIKEDGQKIFFDYNEFTEFLDFLKQLNND